jgi:hypothetical protein
METRCGWWTAAFVLGLAVAAGCGEDAVAGDADGGTDVADEAGDTADVPDEAAEDDAGTDAEDSETAADAPPDDTAAEDGDVPETCGNGTLDPGEDCDGTELGGADCAAAAGLAEGTLACDAACAFDVSGCHQCGNGVAEATEVCDGTDFRGDSCTARGYEAGELICAWCEIVNDSPCRTCGDGLAEPPAEECDGPDLERRDCVSFGWGGGDLACSATCAFVEDACAPTIPVPRRPLNAAYVGSVHVPGSLRPEFSWEGAASPTGVAATYELELASDPTFPAGTTIGVSTAATSHRPATDLPVSTTAPVGRRYWWRVRACVGATCSAWAPVRYFTAGASDRDLNGDGYADVVVSLNHVDSAGDTHGAVRIHFGGPAGPAATPDVTLSTGVPDDDFGAHVALVGDLNADGCVELAVNSTYFAGRVHVFFGAPTIGPDAVADGVLDGADVGAAWYGVWTGPAGDVNGDGYADLFAAASFRSGSGGSGAFWVYFGGPGGSLDTTADGSAIGEGTSDYFGPTAGVGDVDGDGFADLAAAAVQFIPPPGEIAGKAYLYHGGPGTAFDGTADESVVGFAGSWSYFGNDLAGAGDVDDDGFADLLIGAWGARGPDFSTGAVYLFRGGTGTILDATPDATFHGVRYDNLGSRLAAGDVNGDGRPDLLLAGNQDSLPPADRYAGVLTAFLGGPWPYDATADAVRRATAGGTRFADALAFAGDVDGDGFGDVIAGAPGDPTGGEYAGAAYLFLGTAGATFDLVPDWTAVGTLRDQLGLSVF